MFKKSLIDTVLDVILAMALSVSFLLIVAAIILVSTSGVYGAIFAFLFIVISYFAYVKISGE